MSLFFKNQRHAPKVKVPYTLRYLFVIGLLLLAALGLLWRLVDLTIINQAFLQGQGNARTLRTVVIPAYRGVIFDRNGESLAISTPVDSVWINPKEFSASNVEIAKLATLLNLSKASIHTRLDKAQDRDFVYLKRDLDPDMGAKIKALGITGVYLQQEYRRFYPEGEVTAHVLGFTNVDDHGQEGLELAYNQWLQGAAGQKRVLQDRLGHIVADVKVIKTPRPGQNLLLSLDRRIQYFAYSALQQGITKFKAASGSVVVLDVNTGEILAMVNSPSFNPNNRSQANADSYRNRAVTDVLEPGSTIKSFGMVTALTSGKYKVDSRINTSPGWMIVDSKKVSDENNNGVIDLTTILMKSSNVGMSKVILSLPPQNLWNMLHKVGFGQATDSGFPGERSGSLPNYPVWNPFVLCTLSFGYGMSATPLQIAQAYSILAANGVKHPVTFIRSNGPPAGQQVIDPTIASEIRTMLESVLAKGGTAPEARVPGYRVTGKTGTVHIVGPKGYLKNRYDSIFVGIAPASKPRLVVAVVLHNPRGTQYYGGYTSGPIFSQIMGEALRLMNIPPDDLENKTQAPGTGENASPAGTAD